MKPSSFRTWPVRSKSSQQGSEIVEFALVISWFFAIVFLIIETGWFIWQYNTVSQVAQEGARRGSLIENVAGGDADTTIETWVQERLSALGQPGPYSLIDAGTKPQPVPETGDIRYCVTISYSYLLHIQFGALEDLLKNLAPRKESCMPIAR